MHEMKVSSLKAFLQKHLQVPRHLYHQQPNLVSSHWCGQWEIASEKIQKSKRILLKFCKCTVEVILPGCISTALRLTAWIGREWWTQPSRSWGCYFIPSSLSSQCIALGRLEVLARITIPFSPFYLLVENPTAWKPEHSDFRRASSPLLSHSWTQYLFHTPFQRCCCSCLYLMTLFYDCTLIWFVLLWIAPHAYTIPQFCTHHWIYSIFQCCM